MLNYIWLSLIVIGIAVAVGNDWRDISTNRYRNGEEIAVRIHPDTIDLSRSQKGMSSEFELAISGTGLLPQADGAGDLAFFQKARLTATTDSSGLIEIVVDDRTPPLWREMAARQKKDLLSGVLRWAPGKGPNALLSLEPVKFTHLNAVTNDGFIKYAKTAVELAIGLIGIMALWLGVMKIAEASGLVAKIALFVRPVTTRLFPDVPPDHPAMGAMIMNISANMLGLANAATPLGLKAMEELNKLSKKAGTATDAMCTFLVINTSSVQLIPATVIALRSAAGSSNPTEILGPVIVATTVNTVVGIVTVKLLARLPYFRRQLQGGAQ